MLCNTQTRPSRWVVIVQFFWQWYCKNWIKKVESWLSAHSFHQHTVKFESNFSHSYDWLLKSSTIESARMWAFVLEFIGTICSDLSDFSREAPLLPLSLAHSLLFVIDDCVCWANFDVLLSRRAETLLLLLVYLFFSVESFFFFRRCVAKSQLASRLLLYISIRLSTGVHYSSVIFRRSWTFVRFIPETPLFFDSLLSHSHFKTINLKKNCYCVFD